jgi:hypothetical protein
MDKPQDNLYFLSTEREEKLWKNCVFIFDSSALLDFYFLPTDTRKKVFELFKHQLKNRLWIPAHVKFEYEKNREKIIKKPITENYKPLKEENLAALQKSLKDIENKITDLQNKTKKDDKHPHLPQQDIEAFKSKFELFKKDAERFDTILKKQIEHAEGEINQVSLNDDVLQAVSTLFDVGRDFTFSEIMNITHEGKHRYEFSIPPGYEDSRDKEKKGTQIFGDLIIWKQIMEYAANSKKHIVFICNDLKEDWCYLEKEKSSEKRIERPREELVKEFHDSTAMEFWMYDQPHFLYKVNQYLDARIDIKKILEFSIQLAKRFSSNEKLQFECDSCGFNNSHDKSEIDLDFEVVSTEERSMGPEHQYESSVEFECVRCGFEIEATFQVWEYPLGVHSSEDIRLEGATLISCFDFGIDFLKDESTTDVCSKCGESFNDERKIGICDHCDEEYNNL